MHTYVYSKETKSPIITYFDPYRSSIILESAKKKTGRQKSNRRPLKPWTGIFNSIQSTDPSIQRLTSPSHH